MRPKTLIAVALLLLASCGAADPARTFGASRMTGYVDRPGVESLATVERWLEVLEVPERFRASPLNLIFRPLLDDTVLDRETVEFEAIDFDAF